MKVVLMNLYFTEDVIMLLTVDGHALRTLALPKHLQSAVPPPGATQFGHDRFWPTAFPSLATTWFGHDLTNFGHGQFGAFGEEGGWGPKHRKSVGSRRVGARRVGARTQKRWGPEGWGPKGRGPKGGGPKISRFFFLLPPTFSFFFLSPGVFSSLFSLSGCLLVSFFSLWGSSRGILVVFEAPGRSNVLVFAFRLSCGSPRSNTNKIQRKDPKREKEE